MKLNKKLSELIGVFIGDGCLSEYYRKDRNQKCRVVLFTGSWKKDQDYYGRIIRPIVIKYFGSFANLYHRKDKNTLVYRMYTKEIIEFFRSLGYKFGPKYDTVFIPKSIMSDKFLYISCLRGIFNSDGTIYRRYSKKYKNHPKHYSNYKVIQFKCNSKRLIKQIKIILNKLSINTNKISKTKENSYTFRITSQEDINRFIKIIGMNHKHHINRIKLINGPEGI